MNPQQLGGSAGAVDTTIRLPEYLLNVQSYDLVQFQRTVFVRLELGDALNL